MPAPPTPFRIFIRADEAFVGVNDQFVTALDLLAEPVASDVAIGTAFFDVDFLQNRITAYEDFRVWALPSDPASTIAQDVPAATPLISDGAPEPTSAPLQPTNTPLPIATP